MLKKTITFEDLDGNEITEDFYFNLTKAEISEMEISKEGGWSDWLTKVVESRDGNVIMHEFKKIIRSSVGRRSEDGRRFIKNDEIVDDFFQSNAYDALFWEMMTDANAAANFVKGVLPKDLVEASERGETLLPQLTDASLPEDPKEDPDWLKEGRDPTQKELAEMSKEELALAFRHKNKK